MRRSRWLFPWALMAVVAACKRSAPVDPKPSDTSQPSVITINPQGPFLTGWTIETPIPNGAFRGSIHNLPKNKAATPFKYSQGDDTYDISFDQADPCPSSYQGNEIPLTLYKVSRRGENICKGTMYQTLNPNDRCEAEKADQYAGAAIAVPGKWDDLGNYSPCDAGTSCFTISCLLGAVGECAHWGYVPQYSGPDGNLDLVPYLQACVRAASGDYVGNGNAVTCGGTYIDVIDDLGIQKEDEDAGTMTIERMGVEAGWTKDGAVSVDPLPVDDPCVRPRFVGCEKMFADSGVKWKASESCSTPPSVPSREPPYLPKGAPYKLMTRSWLNHGTGDKCVWPDSRVCPAPADSQCFGPHPCPPPQKAGAPAGP